MIEGFDILIDTLIIMLRKLGWIQSNGAGRVSNAEEAMLLFYHYPDEQMESIRTFRPECQGWDPGCAVKS